ncbi:MAG TPA: hypothetical protein VMF31_09660 [Solirubrobacterales bacterium]|nr:hypothetical protein [Solirubrobacterales bacterium]
MRTLTRAAAPAVFFTLLALLFAGCESTQSESARLEEEGVDLAKTEKIDVGAMNRQIEVVDKVVLSDQNGSAVAVVMRNKSAEGLADAPIGIDVRGKNGKSVYRNDMAGMEPSLIQVPVMRPDSEVYWVNDQVLATSKPKSVEVTVGEAAPLPADLPEVEVSKPEIVNDPTSGIEATGTVVNKSDIEQVDLVLYAIARKNGKIVAAGRGQIPRLKVGGKAETFHIFFIGNPTGAEVTVIAPPVNLK